MTLEKNGRRVIKLDLEVCKEANEELADFLLKMGIGLNNDIINI